MVVTGPLGHLDRHATATSPLLDRNPRGHTIEQRSRAGDGAMTTQQMRTTESIGRVWSGGQRRFANRAARPCQVVTETDTRYLDADGDGLLDTVELIESLVAVGPDFRRVLSTRRVVLGAVGDDGEPHEVSVRPG
jgi:hypothetical protein